MKWCAAGGDGYRGWATALHLSARGYKMACTEMYWQY